MSGIKKLESGRYQARYFAGYDARGKRLYPSKTFSHYGDAAKWRTARIREKDLGQQVESSRMTVSEYLDQWLTLKAKQVRTNTIKGYRGAVRQYIKPYLGEVVLQALKPVHIERWQSELLKEISPTTMRQQRIVFGAALNKALRFRYIHHNPLKATDPPRRGKSKVRAFDREQAQAFLAACSGARWGLSYKLMLTVGLRPEELFGLKWSALELEGTHGVCHVQEVVVRLEGGGWQFEEPKSENSYRPIMFPSALAQEMKVHRVAQLQERMAAGTAWHDHDLVFTSVIGTPPNRSDHSHQFKKILRKAGLPETFRLYDLRHTFATIGLLAEVDSKTISEELGHASVAFTLDTYAHVLKEMKQSASDKRERILSGKK